MPPISFRSPKFYFYPKYICPEDTSRRVRELPSQRLGGYLSENYFLWQKRISVILFWCFKGSKPPHLLSKPTFHPILEVQLCKQSINIKHTNFNNQKKKDLKRTNCINKVQIFVINYLNQIHRFITKQII